MADGLDLGLAAGLALARGLRAEHLARGLGVAAHRDVAILSLVTSAWCGSVLPGLESFTSLTS